MAAFLAAIMSSLTSTFNSSSTQFTVDIWRRLRSNATESEMMVVGRLWTLFLAVAALAWMPILEKIRGSSFWDYTQSIGSFILPPIVMTFVLGIIWPRCTEQVITSISSQAGGGLKICQKHFVKIIYCINFTTIYHGIHILLLYNFYVLSKKLYLQLAKLILEM